MNLLRLAARVATPILDALWPPFDEAAAQRALAAHESFGADLSDYEAGYQAGEANTLTSCTVSGPMGDLAYRAYLDEHAKTCVALVVCPFAKVIPPQ
jgi:hypothetical protein